MYRPFFKAPSDVMQVSIRKVINILNAERIEIGARIQNCINEMIKQKRLANVVFILLDIGPINLSNHKTNR
jgi:hypothetical protein